MASTGPLHHAYVTRGLQGLEEALEAGGYANEEDLLGQSILNVVAAAGDTRAIELLLRHGANVNSSDAAIVHAANAGQRGSVRCLLSFGADPTLTNREGYTAAQRVPHGHDDLYEMIVEAVQRWNRRRNEME